METFDDEQPDIQKSSTTELADTNPSSVITQKKPIQLGVVQSSTGVRPSPGNVSPLKKSRWDQAPGSGENEQITKETNVQLNNPGETNIKNLIQKFEDISGGLKSDSNKNEEIQNNKPSRVKLVRTNFTKPDNPIAKPVASESVGIEVSKIEEINLKSVDNPLEVPEADVVSSSKALQIISSNYDSPSDDSQEAESVISNPTQHQAPSDSSFSSLKILPGVSEHQETIESTENVDLTTAQENKSVLKPEDEEKMEGNSKCSISQIESEQKVFVVTDNAEQTDTENTIEMVLQSEDLDIKSQGVEVVEETPEEIMDTEINKVNQHEEILENKIPCESQEIVEHFEEISVQLNENIPNVDNTSKNESENGTNLQNNVIEIINAQEKEQSETFESSDTKETNISKVISEIEEPIENTINDINSTLVSQSDQAVDNDVEVVKEQILIGTHGETTSSFDEEVEDFIIVTQADLEGYTPNDEPNIKTNYSLELDDELSKDIIKDKSSIDFQLKNAGEKTIFNTEICEDVTSEKNSTEAESFPLKETSDDLNQKNAKSFEITHPFDKSINDDKTQLYNDGVDAKMAQMFSETSGTAIGESSSPKQVIEENLTLDKKEQDVEITMSDVLVDAEKSGHQEPENLTETNDSLLEMLESGGSPDSIDFFKENSSSNTDMEANKPVKEVKSSDIDTENVAGTKNMLSVEKKSVSKCEVLGKSPKEATVNEESNNVIIVLEGCMNDTTKELNVESENISNNNEDIVDGVNNPYLVSEESETVIESNIQGSIFENTSNMSLDKEDGQSELQNELDGSKEVEESDILIEEVENIQSSDVISEVIPQIVEPKEDETFAENVSSDLQSDMEVVSETDKDLIVEEVVVSEMEVDSEISQVIDHSKLQSFEKQLPVEEIITKPVEPNKGLKSDSMSNLKSVFVDTNVDNSENLSNLEGVNDGENGDNSEGNNLVEEKLDIIKPKASDSVDSTYPKAISNESEEFARIEPNSVSDSHHNQVDSKQISSNTGVSIEVSQQETIERSIDMLFDVPNNEQPFDSSTEPTSSSTQETKLEVSNETKKLFSEEIHKEMMKLSPGHDESGETDKLTHSIKNSSHVKTSETQNENQSEDTSTIVSDSCVLPDETGLDDSKTFKPANELDKEKEILEPSDDSDIATIQAIDSFLQGDSMDLNKLSSDSKSENVSDNIDESQSKITMSSNEEDSDLFTGCNSTNEKTNAEDVLLGIEGDLDLDNSLTYGTKKLDLSPSSEPSMSEDNYDLPDESYDKDSLVKEQENTNLISEVLDDVDVNTKESDSELLEELSKATEPEEESLLKTAIISEINVCDKNLVNLEDNEKEGNRAGRKDDDSLPTCESQISSPDVRVDISQTEEDQMKKSMSHKSLDKEINPSITKGGSSEIPKGQLNKTVHESPTTSNRNPPKISVEIQEDEVSGAVPNEPKDTTACKGAGIVFENVISSSITSSIERVEMESSSTEAVSCKNKDDSLQNFNQSANNMISETKECQNTNVRLLEESVTENVQNPISDSDSSNYKKSSSEQEDLNLNKELKIHETIEPTKDVELEPSETNTISNIDAVVNEKSNSITDSCETTTVVCSNNENVCHSSNTVAKPAPISENKSNEESTPLVQKMKDVSSSSLTNVCDKNSPSYESIKDEQSKSLDTLSKETDEKPNKVSESSRITTNEPKPNLSKITDESQSISPNVMANQTPLETISFSLEQAEKPKQTPAKEVPLPVRVSARQKQRQAAAAAALAAKEKIEATKSPGQGAGLKKSKKSVSPSKELHIKISGKSPEPGKQSPLISQKSPKNFESKINLQISPKKIAKEVSQDKLEPITLKLSKEENPIIVRSSSLSPKKTVSPHSPQGKTLGYTLKIGKDSTTIIPKESTPSPTLRESSPGSASAKADISGKVGYLIKDTGLTITPVAQTETQEQKLSKITLKLSKAGGHPEIKQENKSETWKAIRKLGEIDIVPVEGKSPSETPKRKDKNEDETPEKKIKLSDVTLGPSTSSGVSKLQGLLTQAPLNQSDSSEDGKFIGFGSPSEKVSPSQQQQQTSYDIGMIRHDDSPQPPRKRGRPRKITSPDDIVHSVSVSHTLPTGLTAKDILAASLQNQSLQQHLHSSFQSQQSYQPPEDLDSSQPMVPLFDLFEETYMDPTPPTIFPDQVQPSSEIIMRSARGRPIGRSRRPRGSSLMRGHERGGPRGRPRGSRGIKRMLEEMEALSYPDPDQPITLENIDAEMGPRFSEHAASELTMALLRKSIEGKKEILEKKARKSDGSEEGNSNLDAQVKEMKEKIEAAYQAELKLPGKEGRKKTPEKLDVMKKSPPGLIPLNQKQDERRKSAEGKECVKRKLSEDKNEEDLQSKRRSIDEKCGSSEVGSEESTKEDSHMDVDQPPSPNEQSEQEVKKEPEPPPKPVKPKPKSKAEIKRIKREKDRLRREAKKLAALEALKAPPPNPCEEDTRMSASDLNGEDGEGSGVKKNRMEVGDPEGKEFTVEQIAEYQWPLQGGELYMIQEQISTWLGVKSFQRKYPDLKRRRVEMEERTYLCDSGLVAESMCDLGLTAVSSSEVLDIMFQDFPEQYEELRKHMREKQARELINKQKERKKFEQTLSKSDLKEHAIQSLASWNSNLNKNRNENRKCHLDLQTWTIQYPRSKAAKMTRPSGKLGGYPVALIPGQYADYFKRYTPQELRYFPVNTVLYGPLQPNEMHSTGGSDGSQSESEDSSSSDGTSDSSSEGEGEGTEEDEKMRECKTCGAKRSGEAMLQCSQCGHHNTTVTVWG